MLSEKCYKFQEVQCLPFHVKAKSQQQTFENYAVNKVQTDLAIYATFYQSFTCGCG